LPGEFTLSGQWAIYWVLPPLPLLRKGAQSALPKSVRADMGSCASCIVHPLPSLHSLPAKRGGTMESKHTTLRDAHTGIAAHLRISAATGAINGPATMS